MTMFYAELPKGIKFTDGDGDEVTAPDVFHNLGGKPKDHNPEGSKDVFWFATATERNAFFNELGIDFGSWKF